ncbi:hypothetical protein DPSP01_004333 [Paraphaeosphaeria sporulosa]
MLKYQYLYDFKFRGIVSVEGLYTIQQSDLMKEAGQPYHRPKAITGNRNRTSNRTITPLNLLAGRLDTQTPWTSTNSLFNWLGPAWRVNKGITFSSGGYHADEH